MRKNSEQLVQNQWFGRGLNFHNLHRALVKLPEPTLKFPMFYQSFAHSVPRFVHKISAALTDAVLAFSAESTGPITTITTFIYKNIEKEAG